MEEAGWETLQRTDLLHPGSTNVSLLFGAGITAEEDSKKEEKPTRMPGRPQCVDRRCCPWCGMLLQPQLSFALDDGARGNRLPVQMTWIVGWCEDGTAWEMIDEGQSSVVLDDAVLVFCRRASTRAGRSPHERE